MRKVVAALAAAGLVALFGLQPSDALSWPSPAGHHPVRVAVPRPRLGLPAAAVEPAANREPSGRQQGIDVDDVVRSVHRQAGEPLAAGPVVGTEHPVADPDQQPAPGQTPVVAFDGTNYLVVWADARNETQDNLDIRAARVTPSGIVLDPTGFLVAEGVDRQLEPAVAFGGGTYLVVWRVTRSDLQADVLGARVSTSGSVLDPTAIPIATSPTNYEEVPVVAFGQGVFLVVWSDSPVGPGDGHVVGLRIDPAGQVLGAPIQVSGALRAGRPTIAFGADAFLVAWPYRDVAGAFDGVAGVRVSPSGTVLDPSGIVISTSHLFKSEAAVAFNGASFLVVWQEDFGGSRRISGARVGPAGGVLDPAGIRVSPSVTGFQEHPEVIALGSQFLVAWYETRSESSTDVMATRVLAAGTVRDPAGFAISTSVGSVGSFDAGLTLGSDGSNYFAVWQEVRGGLQSLYDTQVSAAGVVLSSGTVIPHAASDQDSSAIGFDGTNYLVVWSDSELGLVGARVSPSGRILDASPLVLETAGGALNIKVAFDGRNFLVAWQPQGSASRAVHAALVSPGGRQEGETVVLPFHGLSAGMDVASNRSGFLVTWGEFLPEPAGGSRSVWAARLDPNGVLLDPSGIELSSSGSGPAVGSDGQDYLVTWPSEEGRRGLRVRADGTVPDPAGFLISTNIGSDAAVAWNGKLYLVVWAQFSPGVGSVPAAARVTRDGISLDPAGITLASGPGTRDQPVVAAYGQFLVAWREQGTGRPDGIYGTRVRDDGTLVDPASFVIAASGMGDREPSLTLGPSSKWTVSYTRYRPEAPYSSNRVFFRTIAPK